MNKGYWIVAWRSISDPIAVERYVAPATDAIIAHGGRIVVGGEPARVYEEGQDSRIVVIEFDSLQAAIAAYESTAYQQTLVHLVGAAERDVRIVGGAGQDRDVTAEARP